MNPISHGAPIPLPMKVQEEEFWLAENRGRLRETQLRKCPDSEAGGGGPDREHRPPTESLPSFGREVYLKKTPETATKEGIGIKYT